MAAYSNSHSRTAWHAANKKLGISALGGHQRNKWRKARHHRKASAKA